MKKIYFRMLIAIMALVVPVIATAGTTDVPHFLNYQSLLYDDGGNLLADGPAGVTFKLTDSTGAVLYEEHQTLDVVHGAVSALVGNGLDGAGAPMDGIPASVLSPDSGRYLDVTVDGYPPEGPLEIVSVPYSIYAEKALAVADEAVTGKALAKKSITMDHLADGLVQDLATQMGTAGLIATRTDLTNLQTTFRSTSGASTIGVNAGLVYSGSNNLQAVLQDLDRAIQHRQVGVDAVQTSITNETNSRTTADTTLQNNINAEATARANADATEANERKTKDDEINARIDAMSDLGVGKIASFGTVTTTTSPPTIQSPNATVSLVGTRYDISFQQPISGNYTISVTPLGNTGLGNNAWATVILNKTESGFGVTFVNSPLGTIKPDAFDFTVVVAR